MIFMQAVQSDDNQPILINLERVDYVNTTSKKEEICFNFSKDSYVKVKGTIEDVAEALMDQQTAATL